MEEIFGVQAKNPTISSALFIRRFKAHYYKNDPFYIECHLKLIEQSLSLSNATSVQQFLLHFNFTILILTKDDILGC